LGCVPYSSSEMRFRFTGCSSEAGAGDKKQETVVKELSRLEIASADSRNETRLLSVTPLFALAALPGGRLRFLIRHCLTTCAVD
jgi:hypothetical protein